MIDALDPTQSSVGTFLIRHVARNLQCGELLWSVGWTPQPLEARGSGGGAPST